jgi:hypothetical protein
MSNNERFIKYIPSLEADWLRAKKPWAFLLLGLIAQRARRTSGHIDGLEIGQALIGDYESIGATRGQYREAVKFLVQQKYINKFLETTNFKKTANNAAIRGTIVSLCDSRIWNINLEDNNQQNNLATTNKQPTNNHEQERRNKEEIKKEDEKKKRKKEKIVSIDSEVSNSNDQVPNKLPESSTQHNIQYQNPKLSPSNSEESLTVNNKKSHIEIKLELIQRRENVFTSDRKHFKAIEENGTEVVEMAYDILSEWKLDNPKKVKDHTDNGRIRWACEAARERILTKERLDLKEQANKQMAQNNQIFQKKSETFKKPSEMICEKVFEYFVNGKEYNQAECHLSAESIAFTRGMKHQSLKFREHGFMDQFDNLLRSFQIPNPFQNAKIHALN